MLSCCEDNVKTRSVNLTGVQRIYKASKQKVEKKYRVIVNRDSTDISKCEI